MKRGNGTVGSYFFIHFKPHYIDSGHIRLELGQPEEALVEYLHVRPLPPSLPPSPLSIHPPLPSLFPSLSSCEQALHHAGPEKGKEIRAVICDMAQVLSQERDKEGEE